MSQPAIDIAIREKRFGDRVAMRDIAFTVGRGEIVSLVGPSGCGKSTLLRLIAGLDRDFRGEVQVLGQPPRLHAKDVGFVFQEPRLLPWLTVAQNVGFEAGKKAAKDTRVAGLLAEVGLGDYADAWPKQLSGGMAQRAAIARALYSQPSALLLDEPFSAVDPFTRMRLQDLLLAVAERRKASVLVVTHDVGEAVYLGDRVLALSPSPGRISGEIRVGRSGARDRHDPELARLQSQALAILEHPAKAA
jgi:sulfonate transport system ATP-binding protein